MLGWHISVKRQKDGGSQPATKDSDCEEALAVWQAGTGGLDWLDELVTAGKATHLGGNGYPFWYTARAENLLPRLVSNPPMARDHWLHDAGDSLTDRWLGKTYLDMDAIADCARAEWLRVDAWDES